MDNKVEAPLHNPESEIGLFNDQTGAYAYVKGSKGARDIVVNGQKYEHVANDTDGVWLYRAVAF